MLIRTRHTRRFDRSAFTLMEMMIVVAIIVALAGIGIFYFAGQAEEGNKTKVRTDIKALNDAALMFKMQHSGQYPGQLEDLLARDGLGGPYIKNEESLYDPWNRKYNYVQVGQNNNGGPDIWCDMPGIGKACNWTSKIITQ